jgi:hypothetical protein
MPCYGRARSAYPEVPGVETGNIVLDNRENAVVLNLASED